MGLFIGLYSPVHYAVFGDSGRATHGLKDNASKMQGQSRANTENKGPPVISGGENPSVSNMLRHSCG